MTPPLSREFPQFVLGPRFGQWWRVHGAKNGPWWFASADAPGREAESIGRFDLMQPHGTCYLGNYLPGVAPESLREQGVSARDAQAAANARRLAQMPLDRWHGKAIADFTSAVTDLFGAPDDVSRVPRARARVWADAAFAGGYQGILYRLREDPRRRLGLALFSREGENAPTVQPPSQALPVGLRNELVALFDGEYRGDPLPR